MSSDRSPNPHVPPIAAAAFIAFMREQCFVLEYTEASFLSTFDKLLDLPLMASANLIPIEVDDQQFGCELKSAATTFVGETLAQLHQGEWAGYFDPLEGINFYTSQVRFGEFLLYPVRWLSYRIQNGRAEGSVADWYARVLPSIQAREDLTPPTGFIKDIY